MTKRRNRKNLIKRVAVTFLLGMLMFGEISDAFSVPSYAATTKTFSINEAKNLALAKSKKYKSLNLKLTTQKAKYQSAVESINMQKKRLRTFSWKPLISFKLPQTPSYTQQYDFAYKPLQIMSTIHSVQHQMSDEKFQIYKDISVLFTEIYTAQETLAFNKERLESLQDTLKRNKARVASGEGSQSDVDRLSKEVDTLTSKIANDERNFELKKQQMYEKTGKDVRTGYRFANPYEEAAIPRSEINNIVNWTLNRSQEYYDAQLTESLAEQSMDVYYSILYDKFGGIVNEKMGRYINQARQGIEIDAASMRSSMDSLLNSVNSPWTGKFRVLFFKLYNSWFQGETDGRNYVEDEPYGLYNSILEYTEAKESTSQVKDNVTKDVKAEYETIITTNNSYKSLLEQTGDELEAVLKAEALNKAGELPLEEYTELLNNYQKLQLETYDSLSQYTQALLSYDRLTCGYVTSFLSGVTVETETPFGGDSFLVEDFAEGVSYYISYYVEQNVFEIGVYVPDDFELDVTDFELWINGMQVGERTAVTRAIRHLALDLDDVDQSFLRFYNEDEFIDDVEFNCEELTGPLNIVKGYHVKEKEKEVLGTYSIRDASVSGFTNFTFKASEDYEDIKYYKLADKDDKLLFSEDFIPVGNEMLYLGLLKNSQEDVKLIAYSSGYAKIYTGTLDPQTYEIIKDE